MNPTELICSQQKFFNTNKTRYIEFRLRQLHHLKQIMQENEKALTNALFEDVKKSALNTITTELSLVYSEINLAIGKLKKWSRKKRVGTNLLNFPSRSYLIPEPYGVTLIIGSWNYPYQLTLLPLVSAIAAGNTAIIKPSELTPYTSNALAKLINDNFPPEYIRVIEGGADTARELLDQKFDKIFFTGSPKVGKIVYEAAAKNLTPVTLELGGKNPALVLPDCNIETTAKRIVWGKFANSGQACVAPDYVLVHSSIEKILLEEMKRLLQLHFSSTTFDGFLISIVNDRHFDRLVNLINPGKVYYGGATNKTERWISPTILTNVAFEDEIMKEEIFGPLLPVIRYNNLSSAVEKIKSYDKPLSFYVFGKKSKTTNEIFNNISFGGGSLNDTVLYFINKNIPFGGVGASGVGNYHGEYGFKTFTHFKPVMEKSPLLEFWIFKIPPHSKWKLKLMRWLIE